MFQKDRLDLLEKISRQQSKSAASSSLSTTFPTDKDTTMSPAASSLQDTKNGASLDRLSQGQKTSFYQIKELERRVDFFERELANCFHVVELQARLIKDLLFILPNDGKLILYLNVAFWAFINSFGILLQKQSEATRKLYLFWMI